MALVKFKDFGTSSSTIVTLRANEGSFIRKGVLKKVTDGEVSGAQLYVDDEKPILAIDFIKTGIDGEKSIRKVYKEKTGVSLSVSAILRHYGIKKPDKKIRLEFTIEEKMLKINLEKVVRQQKPS